MFIYFVYVAHLLYENVSLDDDIARQYKIQILILILTLIHSWYMYLIQWITFQSCGKTLYSAKSNSFSQLGARANFCLFLWLNKEFAFPRPPSPPSKVNGNWLFHLRFMKLFKFHISSCVFHDSLLITHFRFNKSIRIYV